MGVNEVKPEREVGRGTNFCQSYHRRSIRVKETEKKK